MKYLDLTNKVLMALREDPISSAQFSSATEYQKLVGLFVDHALKEVEDAWDWSAYQVEEWFPVSTSGNYIGSKVFVDQHQTHRVKVFEASYVYNGIHMNDLKLISYLDIQHKIREISPQPSSSGPEYISFNLSPTYQNALDINVYPVSSTTGKVYVYWSVPSPLLTQDDNPSTGGNYDIKIPILPVFYNALYKAIAERGEDGSMSVQQAYNDYQNSLRRAIDQDIHFSAKMLQWRVE